MSKQDKFMAHLNGWLREANIADEDLHVLLMEMVHQYEADHPDVITLLEHADGVYVFEGYETESARAAFAHLALLMERQKGSFAPPGTPGRDKTPGGGLAAPGS